MRGPTAAAIVAPVAYEPVKNTPSTRLLEQRRADVAAADHRR